MALDFPQPQMDPTAGPEDEEGLTVDMDAPDIADEMEENEDGSVKVTMEDIKGPLDDQDFYGNLAEDMESWDLSKLAMKYIDLIEKDKSARKERDKQLSELRLKWLVQSSSQWLSEVKYDKQMAL